MTFLLDSSSSSIERSFLTSFLFSFISFSRAAHFIKFGVLQSQPIVLLASRDLQVEESLSELDRHVPSLLKKVSTQAVIVARSLGSEVQRGSLVDTAKSVSENVYNKYEPVAEQYAVTAWRLLNRLPLFPQVAQIVVPTASHWSDKYNRTIRSTAEKGYAVASYLPFIPLERIAKVFEEAESGHPVSSNGEQVAVAH